MKKTGEEEIRQEEQQQKEAKKQETVNRQQEAENEEEKKKDEAKKQEKASKEEDSFEEQLAELLYKDKKRAADINFFSFYYDKDQPFYKKLFNETNAKSVKKESGKSPAELSADLLQAAKEGKLYVVSDKEPYLQKVNVDDRGKVSLETVTKNPVQVPQDATGREKKAWENLKEDFETLTKGNLASGRNFFAKNWRKQQAAGIANKIAEHVEDAVRREKAESAKEAERLAKEEKKREKQKEKETEKNSQFVVVEEPQHTLQEEKLQTQDTQAKEAVQQEPQKEDHLPNPGSTVEMEDFSSKPQKPLFEQASDLIRQGDHQEAAGLIAQEMKTLSDRFFESKYMDENAIESGMLLKQRIEWLENSGNIELLDKLEKDPQYKENKELYQGQANLAEMGQAGQEARKKLKEQTAENVRDKETVLDILAAECASSFLVRHALGKDVSGDLKKIAKQPVQAMVKQLKDSMRDSSVVKTIVEEAKPDEIENLFSRGFTSQQVYKDWSREEAENARRRQEQTGLQKENKNEKKIENEARVLENKEKSAPQMGMGK